ncbi:MAG TPA: hypothetical protein VLB02_03145 [Candidatus Paceibacterota bacterium]|nr:hypothetical protein [Candidatus Paceibacterota bacterium]
MTIFDQISIRIIKEQELIIGPVAWFEAQKVPGVIANSKEGKISLRGDGKETIDKLVAQYERLFGRASHEVCKEATKDLIATLPLDQIPSSLR